MGLFTKDDDIVKLPPNKSKRAECWESRDVFFSCLAQKGIDNSLSANQVEKVRKVCGNELKSFENNCVASWVKYFQEKRFNDLTRSRYIAKLESEGAKPLPFQLDNSNR